MLNPGSAVSLNETTTPAQQTRHSSCRFCGTQLHHVFLDLGLSPLANAYLREEDLKREEQQFPLRVYVCDECLLVQLEEWESPENIFGDYAYFSSYSESWLGHAKTYVAAMVERFAIGPESKVVEVASNDGYLLQYFMGRGIRVLGVEPAGNVAAAAIARGVPTTARLFGLEAARELLAEGHHPDLIVGNNVLAQVTDLNGFVAGMKVLLKPGGVITMEFPHLLRLMDENQFDTIYHEHFSYFSLISAEQIFAAHGLTLFDVEEMWTHGGSLRIYARHREDEARPVGPRVRALLSREKAIGLDRPNRYAAFAEQARETKRRLLEFLVGAKRQGKSIAGYGAPGKGNTLLNYCGIRTDFLDYTVDRNPYKHGRFTPGTHIPIFPPNKIFETRPDYVLILPWNLKDEIMEQMSAVQSWGGQFVVPIPDVKVYP